MYDYDVHEAIHQICEIHDFWIRSWTVKYVFNLKKSSSLYPQLGEIYWMEGYDFHEASTYPDSKTVNKATSWKRIKYYYIFSCTFKVMGNALLLHVYVNNFLNCKQLSRDWGSLFGVCVTFGPDSEHFFKDYLRNFGNQLLLVVRRLWTILHL